MVAGYAIGGGHVLHVVCDLTIAADNARFGQTGPRVGSFDGGFGAACSPPRSARRRPRRSGSSAASTRPRRRSTMGLVNTVVPLEQLEEETVRWCREMLELSPFALRLLKASFNASEDGLAGHPAAGARRQPPLLRERGGAGGPRRLPREAPARLREVPEAAVSGTSARGAPRGTWLWLLRRGRARCPAAVAPVLVGTVAGRDRGRLQAAAVRRRAGRQRLHPDRAPTSRTTTRTPAAAPTPRSGSARCA